MKARAPSAARPRRRLGVVAILVFASGLLYPTAAAAHGLVVRFDLPIPEWLFVWAAAVVLIVSFASLSLLWREPKLERAEWRSFPPWLSRTLLSPAVRIVCGAIGVFLFYVVVWSALDGFNGAASNFAPTFIYIGFWLGLVPLSILFGDLFRAFNPWGAIAGVVSWVASGIAGHELRAPLRYPDWLGRWPAAMGILAFAWLEIVSADGDSPRALGAATLIYTAITFAGMGLFGIRAWLDRGEAFSVYFNLFSRLSIFERRGNEIGRRPPLSGLTTLDPANGTVALVMVMIGSVSFDGLSGGATWQDIAPTLTDFFRDLGADAQRALELSHGVGLLASVLVITAFYFVGIAGMRWRAGGGSVRELATAFVPTLVPIAFAYVAAHYVSFLLLQGQDMARLSSDPLGRGWDLFGTAEWRINYGFLSANTYWYLQVGFVVAGHVAALTLAHDRALSIYRNIRDATRSQYWMLAVMVGFTTLALWLLSEQNKG